MPEETTLDSIFQNKGSLPQSKESLPGTFLQKRELPLEEIFAPKSSSPPHSEIDSEEAPFSDGYDVMRLHSVGALPGTVIPVPKSLGVEHNIIDRAQFQFQKGAVKGYTAGLVGDIAGKEIFDQFQAVGPVEKIAEKSGEFVGFIGGVPMKIGGLGAKAIYQSPVGKRFLSWMAKKVGPIRGERWGNWMYEGLALGTASAVSASENTMRLLEDPTWNLGNEIAARGEALLYGAATGARFGMIRDTINKFAIKAAANLAVSNIVMSYSHGFSAAPIEDIVFNSFLDIWFSKHKARPSGIQMKRMRELADETIKLYSADGKNPQDIVRQVVEGSKGTMFAPDASRIDMDIANLKKENFGLDLVARSEGHATKVLSEIDSRIKAIRDKGEAATEGEMREGFDLAQSRGMLSQPLSKKPEYKGIRDKMLERRKELAKVMPIEPPKDVPKETVQAGRELVDRQGKIDKLTREFDVGEAPGEELLKLRAEQRDAVDLFNVMTDKKWEYDAGTKEWKIVGDLSPMEKRPETVEGAITPERPSYIYERVKDVMKSQKPDPLMETVANDLGGDITFSEKMDRIAYGADVLWGPEFALRKHRDAAEMAGKIVESRMLLDFQSAQDRETFDLWQRHLPGWFGRKAESELVRSAAEDVYNLRSVESKLKDVADMGDLSISSEIGSMKEARIRVNKLKAEHPERYRVAESIVDWFGQIKDVIKTHKKEMIREKSPKEWFEAFNRALADSYGKDGKLLPKEARLKLWESVASEYGIKGKKNFEKFTDMVKDYIEVDFWGMEDYITRIERGTWKVFDEKGHVRAVKGTAREAKEEASLMIDLGQMKKADIKSEYSKLDPLTKSKHVLKGEENIFDALKSYAWAVRKRMIIEPLQLKMEQEFANNPDVYSPKMREILDSQLKDLKGDYSWEDQFVDGLFERAKRKHPERIGKPFRVTRAVALARKAEGILKLGYRVVAAGVNLGFGHAHTIAKTGSRQWVKTIPWLRSKEGKAWIKAQEPYIGQTFAEFESSAREIKSMLHPLWLFSRPERGIRRMSLAANYLYAKNKQGMSDAAATSFARKSMRVQSFIYNTTAMPKWMRTPGGKLVGQFKSYMVQEMQFLATLSGKEMTRYLGMTLMLGGPQAIMHVIQSIPFLDNTGLLDKINEWMLSQKIPEDVPLVGGKRWMFGAPGLLLGSDISISAAVQMPNRFEDWAGPAVSDMIKIGKMTYDAQDIGFESAFGITRFKDSDELLGKAEAVTDKVGQFMVELNYVHDILSTGFDLQADGRYWAKDRQNNLLYPIESTYDYIKLFAGAKPIQKAVYQNKLRIFNKGKEKRIAQARDLMTRGIRLYNTELRFPPNFEEDLVRVGIWDASGFIRSIKSKQMPPEIRLYMGNAKVDKLDVMRIFYDELYKSFTDTIE